MIADVNLFDLPAWWWRLWTCRYLSRCSTTTDEMRG